MDTPAAPTQRQRLSRLFSDPGLLATPLALLYCDQAAADDPGRDPDDPFACTDWDPATHFLEYLELCGGAPPPHQYDRLMAALQIQRDRRFFTSPDACSRLCVALAGHGLPAEGEFDPAEPEELAWGLNEALLLAPPTEDEPEPFGPAVLAYLRLTLEHAGLHHPVGVLQLAGTPERTTAALRHALHDQPDALAEAEADSRQRSAHVAAYVHNHLVLLRRQLEGLPLRTEGARERLQRLLAHLPTP